MTPPLAAGPVPRRPLPKPKVDISPEVRKTWRCLLAALTGSYVAAGRLPEEVADHRTAGFPADVVAHAEADRGEFDAWVDMLLEALEAGR